MIDQLAIGSVKARVFVATTSPSPDPSENLIRNVVSTTYEVNISACVASTIETLKERVQSVMQQIHGIRFNLSDFRAISSPIASGHSPRNWHVLSDCPLSEQGSYNLYFFITRSVQGNNLGN